MVIEVDQTGRFTFKETYEGLNGVFTCTQIINYTEAIEQNIDLYKHFYEKINKSIKDWKKDRVKWYDYKFYKLNDVYSDSNVLYIPMSDDLEDPVNTINIKPITDINKYPQMMVTVDLGPTDNVELIESLILSISEVVAYSQGVEVTPRLIPFDQQWLTDKEYEEVKKRRQEIKKNTVNYFSECHRLSDTNKSQAKRITSLEKIIFGLHKKIEELLPTNKTKKYHKKGVFHEA